jgi:hypothetical protein
VQSMKASALIFLFSTLASAACVEGHPSVGQEYGSSKLLIVGKVVSNHQIPATADGVFLGGDIYEVIPNRIFKGAKSRRITLFSENSSGRFSMEIHREYVLFVQEDHGRLVIDNCGNSKAVSDAKQVLAEVTKLSHE